MSVRSVGMAGLGVAALAFGLFASAGSIARADEDDLGAFIYAGTCDSPEGNALFEIGDLDNDRDDPPGVYDEDEDIEATLDELIGSPHVVVVTERDDESSPVIACGAITGQAQNGVLEITLDPVGDSGASGSARFGPNDDDDDEPTTVVTVVRLGSAQASPMASPTM